MFFHLLPESSHFHPCNLHLTLWIITVYPGDSDDQPCYSWMAGAGFISVYYITIIARKCVNMFYICHIYFMLLKTIFIYFFYYTVCCFDKERYRWCKGGVPGSLAAGNKQSRNFPVRSFHSQIMRKYFRSDLKHNTVFSSRDFNGGRRSDVK